MLLLYFNIISRYLLKYYIILYTMHNIKYHIFCSIASVCILIMIFEDKLLLSSWIHYVFLFMILFIYDVYFNKTLR